MNEIETAVTEFGFESVDEWLDAGSSEYGPLDSIVPGICSKKGCDFVSGIEPDQDRGFCEACGTDTVKSLLVILGFC